MRYERQADSTRNIKSKGKDGGRQTWTKFILVFVVIAVCFIFLLQTSYKKEFSTNSLIYGSVLQTEETIQTMQQSVSQSVVNHVKKLLPPQNNISLETADFIVSDNRGDTQFLGYQSAEVFLEDFGFSKNKPFYQYFDEESGALQLVLYYNEYNGMGGGIRYYPNKINGQQEKIAPEGFLFQGTDKMRIESSFLSELQARASADPYAFSDPCGYDSAQDTEIEQYQEKRQYTLYGKPQHYLAQGRISYLDKEGSISDIVKIDWIYREDQSLKQRSYVRNYGVYDTCNSAVQGYYDLQGRIVFENGYITHGSLDYYYIYKEASKMPDYYLYIDHNLDRLYVEFLSSHDIAPNADGKQYGYVGPSWADNPFAQAAKAAGNYGSSEDITHTYQADYDGDGAEEAFVIVGKWSDPYGAPSLDMIMGELYFVDSNYTVKRLSGLGGVYKAQQQYIKQDEKIYLFLSHDIGMPWITDVMTVKDDQPVDLSYLPASMRIDSEGQIMITEDTYDSTLELGWELGAGKVLFTGHTWKPYPFEFNHEQWRELSARELTKEEVEAIAPIPQFLDLEQYESVQYILRENDELNINMAKMNAEWNCINLHYSTFRLGEAQEWEYVESEELGYYNIQLTGESHWDYLDNIIANEK